MVRDFRALIFGALLLLLAVPAWALEPAWQALVLGVTDGDTLRVEVALWPGHRLTTGVRLGGIDAPERRGKCPEERAGAIEAQVRLTRLTPPGARVLLMDVQPDKYAGRVVARVQTMAGDDVGLRLLAEGLVRAYDGGTRQGWCP